MDQRETARLETQDGRPVNLLAVKLSGDLRGLLFEASVEQHFCNPGDKNVEVIYSFPLPWGAVLLGVDVVMRQAPHRRGGGEKTGRGTLRRSYLRRQRCDHAGEEQRSQLQPEPGQPRRP